MRIDGNSLILGTLAGLGSTAGAGAGGGTGAAAPQSPFGPDFLVSLGVTSAGTTSGYAGLPGLPAATSSPATYQFDLAAVLLPQGRTSLAAPMSSADQKVEQDLLKQVLDKIDAGAYEEARTQLNAWIEQHPTSAAATHTLGTLELAQQHYDRAERYFRKADVLAPDRGFEADAENARVLQQDDTKVLARARRLLAVSDTTDDGVRLLVNLTERSADNTAARMALADALLKKHDATNGLLEYQKAIESADAPQLGQIHARLQGLAESAPQAAFLHLLLGRTELRQGRYAEAAQTLHVATGLSEDDPVYRAAEAQAYVGLGHAALDDGDVFGALAQFEQARELNVAAEEVRVGYAQALLARADDQARSGSLRGAVTTYRHAALELGDYGGAELRDRLADGVYHVGLRLESQRKAAGGKVGDEVMAYQQAYDLAPTSNRYRLKLAETRNIMGDEFLADGKYEDAAGAYRRAYDLDSKNATYKANTIRASIAWGDDALHNLRYDDAVTAFRQAYDLDRTDGTSKTKLAGALNARGLDFKSDGKFSEAAADFLEALRLFPDNAEYQGNYDSVKHHG